DIPLEMFQHGLDRRPILIEVAEEDPSLQAGHDHPRTGSRVALRELAGQHASRDQLLDRADELCHRLARCGTQGRIRVVALDSQVHDRTTAIKYFGARAFSKETEDGEQGVRRGRLTFDSTHEAIALPGDGVLEGLQGQPRAAVKVPIDSALLQS